MDTIAHRAPARGGPDEGGQPTATRRFVVELSPAAVQQVLLAHLLTARLGDALASRLDLTVRRDAVIFNSRRAYAATGSYDGIEIAFIPHGRGARLWDVEVGVGGERSHPGISTRIAADRLPMYVDELIGIIDHRLPHVRRALTAQAATRGRHLRRRRHEGTARAGRRRVGRAPLSGTRRAALNRR